MVVGVEVEVGCEKCKAFVGMVAEAVLEAYGRLESERAALLWLRRVEELRCVEVEELGVIDGSSFNDIAEDKKFVVTGYADGPGDAKNNPKLTMQASELGRRMAESLK